MTRRALFKRAAALVGVAVAGKLPMPEPTPAPLKPGAATLKPEGGVWTRLGSDANVTYFYHDSGLHIADYGNGVVRSVTTTGGFKP